MQRTGTIPNTGLDYLDRKAMRETPAWCRNKNPTGYSRRTLLRDSRPIIALDYLHRRILRVTPAMSITSYDSNGCTDAEPRLGICDESLGLCRSLAALQPSPVRADPYARRLA